MNLFSDFLDETCTKFENILIAGDLSLPKISWESPELSVGANEQLFLDILNDHYLSQRNNVPTRGSNILDLVISSMPDQLRVTEVLKPNEAEIFSKQSVVFFLTQHFYQSSAKDTPLCI